MVKKKTSTYKEDHKIVLDFATEAYKKFREVIKSVVLFGSVAKGTETKKSDIDVVIIIDDCTVNWDDELIAWYREELAKIVAKNKHRDKLHINTITLTTFWQEINAGEPLAINIIRYGQAIIDHGGFFDPLKVLLAKGKIKPTPEAVFVTMERAINHLNRANKHLLYTVEGLYWSVVDSAHALLMAQGITPPSPEFVYDLMKDSLVEPGKLPKKYIDYYREIRAAAKEIERGQVSTVRPEKIHELQRKAEEFVKVLRDLTKAMIKDRKILKAEFKQL
jgi:predicted nucleotidyltransferase/uncharacterized protein (UPF0332 family)